MRYDRIKIIAILPLFVSLGLHASVADTALVEHTGLWQTVGGEARQNPALHGAAVGSGRARLS